jgi:hypothetical protein
MNGLESEGFYMIVICFEETIAKDASPDSITQGLDGNLWFAETRPNSIISLFQVRSPCSKPEGFPFLGLG